LFGFKSGFRVCGRLLQAISNPATRDGFIFVILVSWAIVRSTYKFQQDN
jgi:hypothetical protein